MRWLLLLLILAAPAQAREPLWEEDGFKIEVSSGWFKHELIQDWIGIKVGLTIPEGGYATLAQVESFRFWLPCKNKWVYDKGIVVGNGCAPPSPTNGYDTLNYRRPLPVDPYMGCDNEGGRVLLIVRIPHMFPTEDCRPTKVEWVDGGYYAKD